MNSIKIKSNNKNMFLMSKKRKKIKETTKNINNNKSSLEKIKI